MAEPNDPSLIQSLFVSAKQQYESGLRRAGVLLTIAVVFHVAIYGPYIDAHQRIAAAEAQRDWLARGQELVGRIGDALGEIDGLVKKKLSGLLDSHLDGLVNDFKTLSESLMMAQQGEGPMGDRPFFEPQQTVMRVPMQQMEGVETSTPNMPGDIRVREVWQIPHEVAELLRNNAPFEEVRQALLPHIRQTIIGPRFDAINDQWRRTVVKPLTPTLERLESLVAQGRALLPDQAQRWSSLEAAAAAIDRKLVRHTFEPPPGDDWWRTVSDKRGEFHEIESFAMDNLQEGMRLGSASQEIRAALEASTAQQEALVKSMQEKITAAQERFTQQSELLAELGSGLRAVALDLPFVVRWFPMILGAMFTYLTLILLHRLRVYKRTFDLLGVQGAACSEVMFEMVFNPLKSGGRLVADTGARVGLACGWVLLAVWQQWQWDHSQASRLAWSAGIGLGAVVVAMLYRYSVLRPLVGAGDKQ